MQKAVIIQQLQDMLQKRLNGNESSSVSHESGKEPMVGKGKSQNLEMRKTVIVQQLGDMLQKRLNDNESSSVSHESHKEPMVELQAIGKPNSFNPNSMKNCPIDLNIKSYVMKAIFTMLSPLKYEAMVFLFEDIVIFTQYAPPTSTDEQQYVYVDSIPMSDLSIETFELESLLIHLINFSKIQDPAGKPLERYTYILQSSSLRVKENWVQCIRKILWEQLEQCKGSMCLTDDEGNIRVKTLLKNSPKVIKLPNLEPSQILLDKIRNQNGTDVTNLTEHCPEDLAIKRPMKTVRWDPNLNQVLEQEIENQSDTTDDVTNVKMHDQERSMAMAPSENNLPNLQLSQVLRDEMKSRNDTSVTSLTKHCPEDLAIREARKTVQMDPDLSQVLQQEIKNRSDTTDVTNFKKYDQVNPPPQRTIKMASRDRNLPNRQLSQVLRQGMKSRSDSISAVISSIKGCPVDLHLQGSVLMKDVFSVQKPKRYEAMVFLFEEIIVFTLYQEGTEEYAYADHIKISDLSIPPSKTPPTVLHLSDYRKVKNGEVERDMFVLEAKSTKIKDDWAKLIEDQLWRQLEETKRQFLSP